MSYNFVGEREKAKDKVSTRLHGSLTSSFLLLSSFSYPYNRLITVVHASMLSYPEKEL